MSAIGQQMTQDDPGLPQSPTAPLWGIFKDGASVVTAEGVTVFDYKKDWNLPTYTQEDGAFQNYNKVELPYDLSIRFQAGTSVAVRQALLESIEAIDGSLDLYDAVTPEKTYTSCNVEHVDYHRAIDNGLGVIFVDVYLKEVRVTATQSFTNTKAPGGAGTKSGGQKQPQPPSPPQNNGLFNNGFGSDQNIVE